MTVTAEPTDPELVSRMAAGDREAFAALFRRHQATVYRFSRQMLGSQDAAEDVTQEVFIAIAENAQRFDPGLGSVTTYLYGIARNLILQRHKRNRIRVEVDIDAVANHDPVSLAVGGDLAEALARAQLMERLRAAILRLPVHYREAIVLCELHGLSYEDAAAVAKCPVGTIRSRLSRARRMLLARCTELFRPLRAERNGLRAEGKKRWLIPTKNNC